MLEKLEKKLNELGKVAIAYSGGIDSSFLLFIANKVSIVPSVDNLVSICFFLFNNFMIYHLLRFI